MKKKLLFLLCMLGMLAALCAGCGKAKEKPEPSESDRFRPVPVSGLDSQETESSEPETPAPSETESESESETEALDPNGPRSMLSGKPIPKELDGKRPVAVMIENTKACLPQFGLSKADVIYECPVEGGTSRFMAIFLDYSGLERLGSIRSCRTYYIYFAKEFGAIYVCSGKAIYALDLLESSFIDQIDGTKGTVASSFYRTNDRVKPHNYYTSTKGIDDAIKKLKYSTTVEPKYQEHYQFAADGEEVMLPDGKDAAVVKPYYPSAKPWFVYDSEDGLYYRNEFQKKQVDGMTNEQLAVKNIIIQFCPTKTLDDKGYLEIDCLAGGAGKYITNGKCIDITWKRKSETEPTKYYDASGKEITLNQGKTWVCITQKATASKNEVYATVEEYEKKNK